MSRVERRYYVGIQVDGVLLSDSQIMQGIDTIAHGVRGMGTLHHFFDIMLRLRNAQGNLRGPI